MKKILPLLVGAALMCTGVFVGFALNQPPADSVSRSEFESFQSDVVMDDLIMSQITLKQMAGGRTDLARGNYAVRLEGSLNAVAKLASEKGGFKFRKGYVNQLKDAARFVRENPFLFDGESNGRSEETARVLNETLEWIESLEAEHGYVPDTA